MKEKKQASSWYIAATHWLTVIITSYIFGIIVVLLLISIFKIEEDGVFAGILDSLLLVVIIYFSVRYTAKFINKRYIIENSKKVVNLATIYLLIIPGISRIYSLFTEGFDLVSIIGFIAFVVILIIFYITSKKYIRSNTTVI